jgi:hypothetical protein
MLLPPLRRVQNDRLETHAAYALRLLMKSFRDVMEDGMRYDGLKLAKPTDYSVEATLRQP